MNILMVNQGQFGYMAGYYHYCKHLTAQGHKITYLCNDYNLKKVFLNGVDVIYIDLESSLKWRIAFKHKLRELISNKCFDIVLCAYFKGCSILKSSFGNVPVIIDIRSGDVAKNKIKRYFFNKLIKFETSLFSRRMILSQSLADKLKLNKDSYDIVPLGADVVYSGDKDYTKMNLFYVGTLFQRDIYKTIQGIVKFVEEFPNVEINYDIVGFGAEDDELLIKKLIKEYNLSDRVVFHGRINYEMLKPFFEKANIGVAFVPMTPYYDCQPATKIYEYVLSGMYCIATNTYENRILIEPVNGIICEDNADSFYQSLKEYYLCDKTGFTSSDIRNSMSKYQWVNIVNNMLLCNMLKLIQKK